MKDWINLVGSDDVKVAGHNMQSAAADMVRAASNIEYVFVQHQRFLDEWLQRLEQALKKQEAHDDH